MGQLLPSHTDRSEKRVGDKSPFSTILPDRAFRFLWEDE